MVKCDFWKLETTQKLLWFKFEKCLNAEKLLPCYFYHGWSIDPNDLNPTGLDSAFPDLSNKIGFINLVHWIDLGWFLKLGTEVCLNFLKKGLIWIAGLRGKL